MSKKIITRREFLRAAAVVPLAGALMPDLLSGQSLELPNKVRVVLIRDKDVLDGGGGQNPEIIRRMLDDAVVALLGEKDPIKAWKRLVQPSDTSGHQDECLELSSYRKRRRDGSQAPGHGLRRSR